MRHPTKDLMRAAQIKGVTRMENPLIGGIDENGDFLTVASPVRFLGTLESTLNKGQADEPTGSRFKVPLRVISRTKIAG